VPINHAVTIVGYSEGSSSKTVRKCSVNDWWVGCKDETEEGSGEKDAQGDINYWKIQNSWGKNWGDNGFIKFEIQDGNGVCGINRNGIHWASWDHDSNNDDNNDDDDHDEDDHDEDDDHDDNDDDDDQDDNDSNARCFIDSVFEEKKLQVFEDIKYGSAYNQMTEQ